jgi:hypothetical protein
MNAKGNLALAVLAGISIGAVSVMAVHAQEAKTPPAYLIAETEVTDRAAFQKYAEKVPETLAPFQGQLPLCRPWRQDSGSRGPTAKGHRCDRVRQRRESSCLVQLACL